MTRLNRASCVFGEKVIRHDPGIGYVPLWFWACSHHVNIAARDRQSMIAAIFLIRGGVAIEKIVEGALMQGVEMVVFTEGVVGDLPVQLFVQRSAAEIGR
jgi:hypothetical protein